MAERRESYNPLLKSYPDSDKVNAVSEGAEVLYVRLLAQSDDAGRYYGEAKWVLARLFTSRMIAGQVDETEIERRLAELESVGLLVRYRAGDGTYLELIGVFKKLRNDVKPHYVFPERVTTCVTCTGRTRDEFDPLDPTQPNLDPTQPNPTQPNKAPGDSDLPFISEQFSAAWSEWVQYRQEKRKGLTPSTVKKQLAKLATMGEARAVAAIQHSITMGWTGIFEEDRRNGSGPRHNAGRPAGESGRGSL